jgi:Putative addiction module component
VLLFTTLTVNCSKSFFSLNESLIRKRPAFRPRNIVLRDNEARRCDEAAIFLELENRMATPTFDLESEVLNLPPEARARLIDKLMASLEPEVPAKKSWTELAQKRRSEVLSNNVQLVSGEGLVDRIKAKYS